MVTITGPVHRLMVEDVYRMVAAGVLEENARIELVQGVLLDVPPLGPEHDGARAWLTNHFARASVDCGVRVQSMLLAAGGFLMPDLMLVAPRPRGELPTTAHLVVEIAQTSHTRDLHKARDYAAADVTEYWIVDLPGRSVAVHRYPLAGTYQEVSTFTDGAEIKPLLADAPAVDVTALLG